MAKQPKPSRRPRLPADDLDGGEPAADEANLPRARRGRLWRRLFFLVVCLAGLVAAAPTIVAHSTLRDRAADWLLPTFPGRVSMGSASLGWFTPLEVRDLRITDRQGQALLTVGRAGTGRSLLGLLGNLHDLGTIRVEDAQLNLVLRDDGSNLEDVLQPLLQGGQHGSTPVGFQLEIAGGTVSAVDRGGQPLWTLREVQLALDYPRAAGSQLRLETSATMDGPRPGHLEARWTGRVPSDGAGPPVPSGEVELDASHLPLELLRPLVVRLAPDIRMLTGLASAKVKGHWNAGARGLELSGQCRGSLDDLQLSAPRYLGRDVLRCQQLTTVATLRMEGSRLEVEQLDVQAGVGQFRGAGAIQLDHLAEGASLARLLEMFQDNDARLQGELDLAQLAVLLPDTLRLRDDTRITAGRLNFDAGSRLVEGRRTLSVQATGSDLSALRGAQPIHWPKPLQLEMLAHRSSQGVVVERLSCQSDGIQLRAAGDLMKGTLTAECDLGQLARQVGQLADLGVSQLTGAMRADVRWQRDGENRLRAAGEASLHDFRCETPGRRPWSESRMTVTLDALGLIEAERPIGLEACRVTLQSADDRLDVSLLEPVPQWQRAPGLPLRCVLQGQLQTWQARLEPWLPLNGWELHGTIHGEADLTAGRSRTEIGQARVELQRFYAKGPGLHVAEPLARIEATGSWDPGLGELSVPWSTLASTSLSFRADDVRLGFAGPTPTAAGKLALRGDVGRLWRWTSPLGTEPAQQVAGQLTGHLLLAYLDGATDIQGRIDIQDAAFSLPHRPGRPGELHYPGAPASQLSWQPIWHETDLALAGRGRYTHAADQLQLEQVELNTGTTRIRAAGQVSQLATHAYADITGQVDYDLAGVVQRLRSRLGPRVHVAGRQSRPFSLRGPLRAGAGTATIGQREGTVATVALPGGTPPGQLVSPELEAQASLAWSEANLYGLQLGPLEMQAQLARGTVSFSPLSVPIQQGRLTLAPRIDLNGQPLVMTLERGRVLENVVFTPEICHDWLKYVAPLLADATRAEGTFSLDLAAAQVPLTNPAATSTSGVLSIQAAQVGPGPLAAQLLAVAQQVQAVLERKLPVGNLASASDSWLRIEQQNVDFQMADGRVHHRGLEFKVRDVTIRTHGWVALDETMSLVAEIPVLDRWTQSERALAGLSGQVLAIPIQGTLSRPQLDTRALAQLSGQVVRGTAERLMQDEVQKQLQRLLGPR